MSKIVSGAAKVALAVTVCVALATGAEAKKRCYWTTDANGNKVYVCSIFGVQPLQPLVLQR